MTKLFRYLLLTVLGFLVCVSLAWLQRDRLAEQFVRPWLIARVAAALDADVALDRLEIAWQRVTLNGLVALKPETFECRVMAIDIRFNWLGLLQRKLVEVTVRQPELLLQTDGAESVTHDRQAAFPQEAPLTIGFLAVENGTLQVAWPSGHLRVQQIDARGRLGADLMFRSTARFDDEPGIPFRFVGQGKWQDGLELTLEELAWNDRSLLVQPLTIKPYDLDRLGGSFALLHLADTEVAALLRALEQELPWPEDMHWQVEQPNVSFAYDQGAIRLHLATGPGFVVKTGRRWPWESIDLQVDSEKGDIWQLAGDLVLSSTNRVRVDGRWADSTFAGDWQVMAAQPSELLQKLGLSVSAEFGRLADLQVNGGIEVSPGRVDLQDAHMSLRLRESGTLVSDFSGRWHDQQLTLALSRLELTGPEQSGALLSLTGRLSGKLDPADWQGSFQVSSRDSIQLGRAFGILLPGNVPLPRKAQLSGSWHWQDERMTLTDVMVSSLLEGGGLSAQLNFRMNGHWTVASGLHAEFTQGALGDVEYSNADGTIVVVGGRLSLAGSMTRDRDDLKFSLTGEAGAEEALVGSWYADLRNLPLSYVFPGRWQESGQTLTFHEVEIALADLIHLRGDGMVAKDHLKMKGRLETAALDGAFLEFLHRLLGDLVPGIGRLNLAGEFASDIRAERHNAAWWCALKLQPDDLTVHWGDAFRITGLSGILPVQVFQGDWLDVDDTEQAGRLAWTRLEGGLLSSGRHDVRFLAAPNRWQLTDPFEIDAAGGRIRLKDLRIVLQALEPEVQASLQLADIMLPRVSRTFGWPEIGGLLSAELNEVHISRTLIQTGGEATMRAFGGDFRIGNMRIEAPLSRYPTYHADVDFSGINLFELTRTFAFGEINGTADGYVHGLRLFDGIPSAFEASFETREAGTRNISVKAIRNLNTLSQGGLSAALSQGVYRFIDFYRYRKIGILCSLEKDVFHLKGTAKRDSNQYLIYGGWLPPKIDVIVSSPTISFKEMVGRLKRIERTEH